MAQLFSGWGGGGLVELLGGYNVARPDNIVVRQMPQCLTADFSLRFLMGCQCLSMPLLLISGLPRQSCVEVIG